MKYKTFVGTLSVLLVGVLFGALVTARLDLVNAQKPEPSGPIEPQAPVPYTLWARNSGSGSGGTEIWRWPQSYSLDETGGLRGSSALSSRDPVTVFPFVPPSTEKIIESINFSALKRTGSYADTFTLTFEVRDFAGNIQHTVSPSSIDLKTVSTRVWISVTLSSTLGDLVVSPGEYLAIHTSLGGAPGGDLMVCPTFEVKVRDHTVYLPAIMRD